MPLLFILVLGLLLGESFGQKPDDTLMISIVDVDQGPCPIVDPGRAARAVPAAVGLLAAPGQGPWLALPALHPALTSYPSWAEVVRTDLLETPGIRVEVVPDPERARRLIRDHKRPAVLVLEPDFSARVNACSFLDTPGSINPFHREGVYLELVRANLLKDANQLSTASVIEQVVQVSMLRVILPYMIGQRSEERRVGKECRSRREQY